MSDVASPTAPPKPAQKKKGKKENTSVAVTSTEAAPPVTGALNDEHQVNGEPVESSYVKDIQRNIRNVTKKLAATQKVDSIMAENPNVPLDDLVASRKINQDQKAQALKKPGLQAQLAQYEEQLSSYKKVEQEVHAQAEKEKQRLENAHQVELESLRTTLLEEAKAQAAKTTRSHLLTLSTFLRAAASRRQVEDDESEESKAFEGLLLLLYGGDVQAVDAAEKLINGSEDSVTSTESTVLKVSYARVRELAGEVPPVPIDDAPPAEAAETIANGNALPGITSDPTIAHAGLTEQTDAPLPTEATATNGPEQADVDSSAANAAAATNWDSSNTAASISDPMAESWVSVPRPADETEKDSTPAQVNGTSNLPNGVEMNGSAYGENIAAGTSWADESAPPVAQADDGFHEVQRHRGRGRGGQGHEGARGDGRGRGRGRGGGARGEFRGGRGGGGRGGRGGPRRGDGGAVQS